MRKYLLAISMHCCLVISAQNSSPKELQFNRLFLEDGLVDGSVRIKLQDKEGYVWLGSNDGLVRYDGYKPKTYSLPSNGLNGFIITKIFEDERGELWVGTRFQGLYHYDRANDKFIQYGNNLRNADSISKGEIRNITDDNAGNIWINIWNDNKEENTINSFNTLTQRFKHYSREESGAFRRSDKRILASLKDDKKNIWFATENGLYKYDNGIDRFIPQFKFDDTSKQRVFVKILHAPSSPGFLWTVVHNKVNNGLEIWRFRTENEGVKKYWS